MATNVKLAHGTLFKKGSTTLAEVKSLGGPGIKRNAVDCTHMESANNAMDFIPALTDSGEISVDLNFLPGNSTQKEILTDIYAKTTATYSIVWIDGPTTWSFTAFPTGFEPKGEVNDRLQATATFKITGQPTFPA